MPRPSGPVTSRALVALVGLVPFLGALVKFLVLLLGLGGLAAVGFGRYRRRRNASGSAEPAA